MRRLDDLACLFRDRILCTELIPQVLKLSCLMFCSCEVYPSAVGEARCVYLLGTPQVVSRDMSL